MHWTHTHINTKTYTHKGMHTHRYIYMCTYNINIHSPVGDCVGLAVGLSVWSSSVQSNIPLVIIGRFIDIFRWSNSAPLHPQLALIQLFPQDKNALLPGFTDNGRVMINNEFKCKRFTETIVNMNAKEDYKRKASWNAKKYKGSLPVRIFILFYSILFYSILFCSILFYSILFYSILFYSILIFLFRLFCFVLFCFV